MMSRRLCRSTPAVTLVALSLAACSSSTSGSGSTGTSAGAGSTAAASSAAPSSTSPSSTSPSSTPASSTPASSTPASSAPGSSSSSAGNASAGAALSAKLQKGLGTVKTAHLDFSIDAGSPKVSAQGDEKLSGGKVSALHLTEKVGSVSVVFVIVDGKIYAKLPASVQKTSKPYVLVSTKSKNASIRQLASTLTSSLDSSSLSGSTDFVHAATSVRDLGHASVDGTSTTHYKLVVDPKKLPTSNSGRAGLISGGVTSLPVDLYVDSSGRTVRVLEKFTVSGRQVSTTVDITKYNKPVTVTAPPASQVGSS